MQVKSTQQSDTKVTITVVADSKELKPIKQHVLTHFQGKVKVPGFRTGKVPAEVIEKHIEPQVLQSEFLEEATQQLYMAALKKLKVRPANRPQVSLKKFVPYSTLEFSAELEVVGEVTLPDYSKIKKKKPAVSVTDKEVDDVLASIAKQLAEKKDVDRASKEGDQVWIDFSGVDAKTKEPIKGADGRDYPLVLGSNTFIPGFEPELVGVKPEEKKTFTVTFPKDYGVSTLQNKKVMFDVTVKKVQEVTEPKIDDAFAAKAGPFKTLEALKKDIRQRLAEEKQHRSNQEFESELVKEISNKSKVSIPETLVDDQVERLLYDQNQNLLYRGQTMKEFLEAEGKTEKQYRDEVLKPQAAERVKAGLVLAEISEKEKLDVTPQEVDMRMQLLKAQYPDEKMRAELDKPEAKRDIAARLLTEKTIDRLVKYATESK